MQRASKKTSLSDDAIGWVGIALGLIAAIVLDKVSAPHKWQAAIMWTFVAFFGVLIWGRQKRNSWVILAFLGRMLGSQRNCDGVIFGQLLPRLMLGTLYVVPLAFFESLFLFVAFLRLERKVAQHKSG